MFFSPRNGVVPPSGQVNVPASLSVSVDDDGVVGDAEIVEFFQELAELSVVLDHTFRIKAESGFSLQLGLGAWVQMCMRGGN